MVGGERVDARWIQMQDDGRVALLAGRTHDDEAIIVDLYLEPAYSNEAAKPLPCWFLNLLNGSTPGFHTLSKAIHNLNDWHAMAEICRYQAYDD